MRCVWILYRKEKLWEVQKVMNYENIIELDNVTLEDCIDLYEKKNVSSVICDGHITDFVKE